MKNYEEFEKTSYENTVWENPTEHTVTVKVWRGPETSPKPWLYLTIPPGESRSFPSEYDSAIHTLDTNGIIVGGKGPLLRKKDSPYLLHPVLDTDLQARKKAIDDAANAIAQRNIAEQASILAQSQIKIAQEAQNANLKLQEKVALDKKAIKELQEKMVDEKTKGK